MTNLVKRSIFGALFLAVTVGALFWEPGFMGLMMMVIVFACHETFEILVPGKCFRKEKICVVVACLTLLFVTSLHFKGGLQLRYLFAAFLPVILAWLFMLKDCADDYAFNAGLFFPLLYVALPVTSSLILVYPDGFFTGKIVLGMFIMIWCCDVGAYCLGTPFGQKPGSLKLAPKISPKKSWIGVAGGTLCTLIAAFVIGRTFGAEYFALVHWMVLGVIVSSIGVCGDLFESLLKRHAGVKDSGNVIPGHGGILDRFDDVLFLFPLFAIYLKFFFLI